MPTLRIDNVPVTIGYHPITIGGADSAPAQAPPGTYFFECRDGQTLSQILHQEYGYIDSNLLFEVLDLNQGLSSLPLILTVGTTITLPKKESPIVPTIPIVTLWD